MLLTLAGDKSGPPAAPAFSTNNIIGAGTGQLTVTMSPIVGQTYNLRSSSDGITFGAPVTGVTFPYADTNSQATANAGAGLAYYQVQAVNAAGSSPWSASASASPFLVWDNFHDTNGTTLESHVPNVNTPAGAWTKVGTVAASIQGNLLQTVINASNDTIYTIQSGVGDATITVVGSLAAADVAHTVGPNARQLNTTARFEAYSTGNGTGALFANNTGSQSTASSWSADTGSHTHTIVLSGMKAAYFLDGVLKASFTGYTPTQVVIPLTTAHGLDSESTAGSGNTITRFSIYGGYVPPAPTTWYVSTTGNDGHAGTSTGTAFLTIDHALNTAAGDGDTIIVSPGTYAENSGAAGWLALSKGFLAPVTIKSSTGNAADVIITGTGVGADNVHTTNACGNIAFLNVTLQAAGGTVNVVNVVSNCYYLTFTGCVISGSCTGNLVVCTSVYLYGMAITSCTLTQTGTGGLLFSNNAGTGALVTQNLTITGGIWTSQGGGVILHGCFNLLMRGCSISALTGSYTCQIGVESAATTTTCTAAVYDCQFYDYIGATVSSTITHCFQSGCGSNNLICRRNYAQSHTTTQCTVFVPKANDSAVVVGNVFHALPSTGGGFEISGCTNSVFQMNFSYDHTPANGYGAATIELRNTDSAACQNCTFENNWLISDVTEVLMTAPASGLSAGSPCITDYNVWDQRGSGAYGTYNGTVCATFAAIQAAATAYNAGNESHSQVPSGAIIQNFTLTASVVNYYWTLTRNSDGAFWTVNSSGVAGWAAGAVGDNTTYLLPEDLPGSGTYRALLPLSGAGVGTCTVNVYTRLGYVPAVGDTLVGTASVYMPLVWNTIVTNWEADTSNWETLQ
jgi:hypothetical protein